MFPETENFTVITGLLFYLSQNFCSEAVCYSEMITRKIERNQLGRDQKSFIVQVTPVARQKWVRVNVSKCSPWQHKGLSRRSDMFTHKKKAVASCHPQSFTLATPSFRFFVALLLCSPASFPSLFLHLHPLFLLFCSSLLSASSASP